MKQILHKFILLSLVLLQSCATNKNVSTNGTAKYDLPFADVVTIAKEHAKALLISQGAVLPIEGKCFVSTVKGTHVLESHLCYERETLPRIFVMGEAVKIGDICYITIVACPNDSEKVNYNVLVHEFAHYWLIFNYGDYKHASKYKDCFLNWFEPPVENLENLANKD